jgi:hypothetical protein
MTEELKVLGIVSDRLQAAGLPFMLTGSFAMAYYGRPRMTRDLDIVVAMDESHVGRVVSALSPDFYIDVDAVRSAVVTQRMFNLLHLATGIKVDLIVRRSSEYRRLELERRRRVQIGDIATWIVSREDLILSKLVWARDSGSELQRRDAKALLDDSMDRAYVNNWAVRLGVADILEQVAK